MNKRFFTLLASVALLFTSAFAAPAAPAKATVLKADSLYHLLSGTADLLYVGAGDTLYVGDTAKIAAKKVGFFNSLWCAEAEQPSAALYPQFTFTNKGAEAYLSVNIDSFTVYGKKAFPAVISDGDVSEWKFSSKYLTSLDASANYLASYIKSDTIAVLTTDGSGNVFVEVVAAPEGATAPAVTKTLLTFNLAIAEPRVLTAAEFNTVLGLKTAAAQKLTFTPDKNGVSQTNPFSGFALKAFDAPTTDYVSFFKGDKATDTLRVDTAYINAQGVEFLDYAFGKVDAAIAKQSEFKLTYYPYNDSLTIQVGEARYKPATGTWVSATPKTDQFVSIQDLVKADNIRIVTVNEKQNTHISFGIGGCSNVGDDRTTQAEGLYYIKNKDGKYLVAPIFTDSSKITLAKATWVTLEANVDPSHLPAYQWIVEKTKAGDKYATTSPVTITNREYPDVKVAEKLQLYTGKAVVLEGVASTFEAVSADVKKNATLGYKAISLANEEYLSHIYTFNYLHQFDGGKYLDVKSDSKDSLIYVADDATSFQLIPQGDKTLKPYGKTISGIAQLQRISYKLVVKDSYKFNQAGKYLAADTVNNRYYLVDKESDASIFFLKENNYKDGKPYYALVDTTTAIHKAYKGYVKVAIDDNNVFAKVNPITEIRTSAFAVEENKDPLYRRFDGQLGTVNESNATDAADTLEIFREREPSDVLYENALLQEGEYGLKDKSVNFLGVRNKTLLENDGITRNYSLFVDTAYVNRGSGTVKPQYLISLRPDAVADSIKQECYQCGTKETVYPGYEVRWFLVNTTQYGKDANKVVNYQWNTKWDRLAFVQGVRRGDSLYIFQPGYITNQAARIDWSKVKADASDKKKVRFYNLGDNKHKDVVWQFRLINNVTTDPTQTFLIESENEYRIGTTPTDAGTGVSNSGTVIAPLQGGWVKIQNGVPVISRGFYSEAITDAESFNVKASDEAPVANEEISGTEVVVVAGTGNVTIYNAAGKTVTISNVLGQAVAKQVLSSDAASISAPKGVVVVAVEGEKAVKAVVK